jgi:hypothetical protein
MRKPPARRRVELLREAIPAFEDEPDETASSKRETVSFSSAIRAVT